MIGESNIAKDSHGILKDNGINKQTNNGMTTKSACAKSCGTNIICIHRY